MSFDTWQAFYASDLQSVHALVVVPALFLLALLGGWLRGASGAVPEAAGFVRLWAGWFAIETIVDPIATGPVAKALASEGAATALMFGFVWLGDIRVMWPILELSKVKRAVLWALVATPVVGGVAVAWDAVVGLAWPDRSAQILWLVYELGFAGLALVLRSRLGAPPVARAMLVFVAVYYALWALSDVIILSGVDLGWALRVVPNQLYYAFTVPVFYWLFFGSRFSPDIASK